MSITCGFFIWWKGLSDDVVKTESFEELITLITREGNLMGFSHFSLIIKHAVPFTHPYIDFFGNYPDIWVDRYKRKKYLHSDPVFLAAEKTRYTIAWQDSLKRENATIFLESKEYGINDGFSQSALGNDGALRVLSFSGESLIKNADTDLLKLKISCISGLINARINGFETYSSQPILPSLSFKEKEILKWTADGKIAEEIGTILNISESTVNFHICNIQKKFNAPNKTLAVAYSAACRLLTR